MSCNGHNNTSQDVLTFQYVYSVYTCVQVYTVQCKFVQVYKVCRCTVHGMEAVHCIDRFMSSSRVTVVGEGQVME